MKQRVDYSGFSLLRLNEPRFSHAKLLAGWIGYFAMYFITENLIPIENCHPVWCRLDDLIPFNEFFVIFYVGWYALVFGALAYTFFFDVENFRKIQIFIMITQAIAMATYIIWPSRQDLRPEVFERSNFLTWLMGIIYGFDTSTGVCPSLHVAYSLGILSAALKDKILKPVWKTLITAFVIMICLSVCFVKQHSAVDVFAALPVALIAEALVWKDYWLSKFKGEKKDVRRTAV
ncbi:MAG: phosphatidic acid phosphatase [Oscillospiraceae bacterium]|nr:phosphatidic acid phosphatase [Oscillospiraceae bacterium]